MEELLKIQKEQLQSLEITKRKLDLIADILNDIKIIMEDSNCYHNPNKTV